MKNSSHSKEVFVNFFQGCFQFLGIYKEENSQKRILNIMLSLTFSLILFLDTLVIYKSIISGIRYHGVSILTFSSLGLLVILIWLFARNGHETLSSYALILLYLIASVFTGWHWGFDVPTATLAYVLVITISSILISTRFGLITTVAIATFIMSLGYFQIHHRSFVDYSWRNEDPEMIDTISYSLIFCGVMTIAGLTNNERERLLNRALESEESLKNERDALEITVLERIKELRKAEMEKISQMYHFVELGRLSSGIIHDLVNPLTSLCLYIETFNNQSEEANEYLSRALKAGRKMESFINLISKNTDIEYEKKVTNFEINQEIKEAIEWLNYKSKTNKVEIYYRSELEVYLEGDPLKFHQIVSNLLSNAIDAASLSTDKKVVLIEVELSNDLLIVKFSNSGPQIEDINAEKIFDPFFTTKSEGKGMGLGLFTTKSITEKVFGGKLSYENKDIGVIFILKIPRNKKLNDRLNSPYEIK